MRSKWMRLVFGMLLSALLLASAGAEEAKAEAAKTKALEGAEIVVDPGHGGQSYSRSYTGGTQGAVSKVKESELNLKVGLELAKLLEAEGAKVIITRVANHRLSPEGSSNKAELGARVNFFEHYGPHFFLSVHHNAGNANSKGHTALSKANAADPTLYVAAAQCVNDALEGVVQGPKLKLITEGDYHILRETNVPGTISEAGFMTNTEFDEMSMAPDFPKKEAEAICKGAIKYWTENKAALVALREKLAKEREAKKVDPNSYTANALNPGYQERMKKLLAEVAPEGKYDPAGISEYLIRFRKSVVTDPAAKFDVTGIYDGKTLSLKGETSDRKYHDELINVLVAMKIYDISNEITFPKTPKEAVGGAN
jgi:N-acetylmuramoyl-L-alanine amidase